MILSIRDSISTTAVSIKDTVFSSWDASISMIAAIPDQLDSKKIQNLALPTLAIVGAIYFGMEYQTTQHFLDLSVTIFLGAGGIQELIMNLVSNDLELFKKAGMIEKALVTAGIAFTIFSLLAVVYYGAQVCIAYQGSQVLFTALHFILALHGLNYFNPLMTDETPSQFVSSKSSTKARPQYQKAPVRQSVFEKGGAVARPPQAAQRQISGLFSGWFSPTPKKMMTDMSPLPRLQNLGNTCFFNATLKAFFSMPGVREALGAELTRQKTYGQEEQKDGVGRVTLTDHFVIESDADFAKRVEVQLVLRELYSAMTDSEVTDAQLSSLLRAVLNTELLKAWCFNNHEQHDANELLTVLSQAINYELNRSATLISRQYCVPLENPQRPLTQNDFSLRVPDGQVEVTQIEGREYEPVIQISNVIHGKKEVTIQELLEEYFKAASNNHCTEPRFFANRLAHDDVSQLNTIGMRLPRFCGSVDAQGNRSGLNRNNQKFTGLTSLITIPVFDIATDRTVDVNLQIRSASCHHGGLNGGHYIALVRKDDGSWEYHSDSTIQIWTQAQAEAELSKSAYNVFFEVVREPLAAPGGVTAVIPEVVVQS